MFSKPILPWKIKQKEESKKASVIKTYLGQKKYNNKFQNFSSNTGGNEKKKENKLKPFKRIIKNKNPFNLSQKIVYIFRWCICKNIISCFFSHIFKNIFFFAFFYLSFSFFSFHILKHGENILFKLAIR